MTTRASKAETARGAGRRAGARRRFVVHEHHASRLHFDFRLEAAGVLKSWAVPKGPSLDPTERRLAVEVEDHSLAYGNFEGTIDEGRYGAGEVRIWDEGFYETEGDAVAQIKRGRLSFTMFGRKLGGAFSLVRMSRGEGQWLLIKSRDEFAEEGWALETVLPPRPTKSGASKQRGTNPATAKKSRRSAAAARAKKG